MPEQLTGTRLGPYEILSLLGVAGDDLSQRLADRIMPHG